MLSANTNLSAVKAVGGGYDYSCLLNALISNGFRKKIAILCAVFAGVIFSFPTTASAQQFSLKTNLLYDAAATINVGAELRVAPRWSIDLSGNYNAWTFSNGSRWKHWLVQPEVRYWFCDATAGHFLALHGLGAQYNVGHLGFARSIPGYNFGELRDKRYQGLLGGAGLAYGYSWILGRHWGLEAELGLGWIYTKYDIFECEGCGRMVGSGSKHLFAPTKAAINLVYVF